MGQLGFFDADKRLAALSAKGDPLEAIDRLGRVEDGRGSLGHAATLRFPSPLIEPDVRISRIRLSDWLRREAHGKHRRPQASSRGVSSSFVSRYSFL